MGLFDQGILGINARNLLYICPFNKDKNIEIADDKLKTKAFLSARDIPVPKLLGVISNKTELSKFKFKKLGGEFVLKPNLGYGGGGIIPIVGKHHNAFIDTDGSEYTEDQIREHIKDILNGNYAISDKKDKAFFEKTIISDDILGKFAVGGLPDIRVIVHKLVPMMAMVRIPTAESKGKANLHQGAIGAGIDLAKGEVSHLFYKNKIIKEIPGKGSPKGIKIPFWDDILKIACNAQLATNLGYLGADIAIDKQQGPVLIEINARAGIGIQLANLVPLRKRLEKIEGTEIKSVQKGIRIAKDMFGYSIEKNIKTISGKKVIGLYENIDLIYNKETFPTVAFISTARKKSYLGTDIAKKIGLITSKKRKDLDKERFKLKVKLGEKKITTLFKIDKNIKRKYQVILGNRDIGGQFLIDTSINNLIHEKKAGETKKIFITNYDPLETDRQLCKIINQIKFLSYFRPVNFIEEAQKFILDKSYNPQFKYKEYGEDLSRIKQDLRKIKYDNSDLGKLFKNKIVELEGQISLIETRGSEDFTDLSKKIFGTPSDEDFLKLSEITRIKNKTRSKEKITSEELKEIFEKQLLNYDIKGWRVLLKRHLLTKCVVNRNKKILIQSNSFFNKKRVESLLIHEIDTHLLTSENGSKQKYKLFNFGFANYLETQEGLAMHNVITQAELFSEQNHKHILTKAIYWAQHMSLAELYAKVKDEKLTDKSALDICFRVKRGLGDTSIPGAFTKDFCYYSGWEKIKIFLANGGELTDLYHGKYSIDDLPMIKNITRSSKPEHLPKWLI